MKNKLFENLKKESNITQTENLAKTYNSSLNRVLDFFSMGGALRNRSVSDIISLFSKGFSEEPLLTLKSVFYFRDIRQGQGERRTFRIIMEYIAKNYPHIFIKNLSLIPEYGRWDDIFVGLKYNETRTDVANLISHQLTKDLSKEENRASLLGKWLPSENAGIKAKKDARDLMKVLKMNPKQYRMTLSTLRSKINIVECQMCSNKWESIDFSIVPSKASLIYAKAFKKHDETRYQTYLDSVKKGEKKINTATLYPYEILRKAKTNPPDLETLNLLWDNLPDYCSEGEENSIVVCDTSGSMSGLPMDVSTSLGLYFAERNKGVWQNHFITFSMEPKFQEVIGNNLYEKYLNLNKAKWEMNTDLIKVFELILNIATQNNVPASDMIEKIYIVSDMEFDSATGYDINTLQYIGQTHPWIKAKKPEMTNFEKIKQMYTKHGYKLPLLVFWNVNSRHNQSPVTISDSGVWMVSGCSPTIFKRLMKSEALTVLDLMNEVLNSERYSQISL